MSELVKPTDLKRIAAEVEARQLEEALERKRRHDEEELRLREEFMSRQPPPDALERFSAWVKKAAANGLTEIKAMQFPASYCTDGGRAINNNEPNWPDSLQGGAKAGYEFFKKHLEPAGYRVRAQILSYPGGNLGDVGIFVSW